GLIVGDDNGALRPIGAIGDRVDRIAQKGFADLRVGVARVIVVAGISRLDRRAGRARNEAIEVAIPAADVIDSAASGAGQGGRVQGSEEVAEALHVCRGFVRVVGLIAEILRGIVMGDVAGMGGYAARVDRLKIIAELVPGPRHRSVRAAGDLLDVLLHIEKVEGGVQVGGGDALNLVSHERESETGIRLVGSGVGAGSATAFSRLPINYGGVQSGSPEWL